MSKVQVSVTIKQENDAQHTMEQLANINLNGDVGNDLESVQVDIANNSPETVQEEEENSINVNGKNVPELLGMILNMSGCEEMFWHARGKTAKCYHYYHCDVIDKVKARKAIFRTREEWLLEGKEPCGNCEPP